MFTLIIALSLVVLPPAAIIFVLYLVARTLDVRVDLF